MKKGNTGIKKVDRNKPFTTSDIAVVTHHKDGLDVVEAAGVTFLTYIEAEQKNGNHAGCICCLDDASLEGKRRVYILSSEFLPAFKQNELVQQAHKAQVMVRVERNREALIYDLKHINADIQISFSPYREPVKKVNGFFHGAIGGSYVPNFSHAIRKLLRPGDRNVASIIPAQRIIKKIQKEFPTATLGRIAQAIRRMYNKDEVPVRHEKALYELVAHIIKRDDLCALTPEDVAKQIFKEVRKYFKKPQDNEVLRLKITKFAGNYIVNSKQR